MDLLERLESRIVAFDKSYSRFRPDSLVTVMSHTPGSREMPADGYKLIDFYHSLYQATGGLVTPLIGRVMADAGYDDTYSFQKKALSQPPSWRDTISYDKDAISLRQPALLDFGAAGKGYLVDIVGKLLEQAGIDNYFINAGGDIRQRSTGNVALDVGLENPTDTSEAVGIAKLTNASLCASAGNKRQWAGINHIINPRTLLSPADIVATWVIADETITADGLATALFFTEPAELLEHFSFSFALLHDDMSMLRSNDFPVKVFEAS